MRFLSYRIFLGDNAQWPSTTSATRRESQAQSSILCRAGWIHMQNDFCCTPTRLSLPGHYLLLYSDVFRVPDTSQDENTPPESYLFTRTKQINPPPPRSWINAAFLQQVLHRSCNHLAHLTRRSGFGKDRQMPPHCKSTVGLQSSEPRKRTSLLPPSSNFIYCIQHYHGKLIGYSIISDKLKVITTSS